MKHVIALTPFYDVKEGTHRKAGEEFDVTEERFDEINEAGKKQLGTQLINECQKEPFSPEGRKAEKKKQPAKKKAKKPAKKKAE